VQARLRSVPDAPWRDAIAESAGLPSTIAPPPSRKAVPFSVQVATLLFLLTALPIWAAWPSAV
jgi:hypothetical protein